MNPNNTQQKTMGEFLQSGKVNGAKSIVVAVLVSFLLIGVVYTGIHNFNLFSKTLAADQSMFAIIPVILLEGGILLFLAGSFVWFSGGSQKLVATISGWALFGIVAANTLVDSLMHTEGEAMPSWLTMYATFILYAMPVVVMAILKLILDLDPAKKKLDMEKAIEHAMGEAKFAAMQKALGSEHNRAALLDYGEAQALAMAANIRASSPEVIDGKARTVTAPTQSFGKDVSEEDMAAFLAWKANRGK